MLLPAGRTPPFQVLIKLGRAVTPRDVSRLLTALLCRRRHRLVAALFAQALANSLPATPRAHFLAASALLASGRPRDAERLALAAPAAFGFPSRHRLWDALVREACARERNPRRALELLSVAVEKQGAVLLPATYRMMVSEFCDCRDMASALKVFDVMTGRENGSGWDDYVCSLIISGFSNIGKAAAGLEFYESVRREFGGFEPNTGTLTAVVDALGQEGRISEAMELVREMEVKGMVGDAVFYGSWVHGYMRGGFLMEGLRKHKLMLDKGIAPDVINYTTVIDGLCKEGSVEKVMGFLDEMERRNVKPNLITYTSLVGGFCKRNRLEDAFSIVRTLEQTGVVVDEYVYSILIDSLSKRGYLDKVFSLLEEMENKGIKTGTVTYNAVINGLCKAGDTDKAVTISEGVVADNFTYSTLLHGYMKEEDATGVLAIKSRLETSGIAIDIVTCNVLIKSLFMINKADDACDLFRKMPEMGVVANTVTYHVMIEMMCKLGEIDQSLELFDEYKKGPSFSGTVVHNCLIRALCKGGKVYMADKIFMDLVQKNLYPDSYIWRKLIRAHFKEGGGDGVLEFIRRVEEPENDLFSLVCNYASAYLSTRDCCRGALDVYKLLRTRSFTVTSKTCYTMFKSFLRNGSEQFTQPLLSECIKIHGLHEPRMTKMFSCYLGKKNFGEAVQFSGYIGHCTVPVSILRGAVYALKKQGEIMDAYNFLKEAEQSGFSVDLAMYSIVVDGLCKGGYLEKALDLCESMQREGLLPNIVIYNSVLNGLCHQGCLTEAFRLFDYLESSDVLPTAITYAILIGALCREGFLDDANQLFQRMSNKGITPTTHVYNMLISGYCNFGLTERALELMSHLEKHFLLPDAFTLGAIISGHCLKGDTESALGFFNEYRCKEMVPDFVGFMSLVRGFYAKGRIEESRGILREMFQCTEVVDLINSVGDDIQAESLVSLLSVACEQGRIHEVVAILNEVRLMSISSSNSCSYDKLAHLKMLQRAGDAYASRTDSVEVLNPATYEVSNNCHRGSSEGITQLMTDKFDNLITADEHIDIDYEHLLGKSFYDDFDTYYPAIASLCSKGELLKVNNAIETMIQNSG